MRLGIATLRRSPVGACSGVRVLPAGGSRAGLAVAALVAVVLGLGSGCSDLPPSITGKVAKDLTAIADLDQDMVKGKWTKDDSGLHTTTTSFGRLQIPYIPGQEYDVKLVTQRSGGTDMIALGLVKGDVQFVVGIDGSTRYVSSGFDRCDGKPFSDNPFTVKKTVLDNAKASTILVQVRDLSLTVVVDGTNLIEWKDKDKDGKETGKPIDYNRLSLSPDWKVPLGKALFVGAFSEYTITTLELTNVTKAGKFLR